MRLTTTWLGPYNLSKLILFTRNAHYIIIVRNMTSRPCLFFIMYAKFKLSHKHFDFISSFHFNHDHFLCTLPTNTHCLLVSLETLSIYTCLSNLLVSQHIYSKLVMSFLHYVLDCDMEFTKLLGDQL